MRKQSILLLALGSLLGMTLAIISCSKSGDKDTNPDNNNNGNGADSVLIDLSTRVILPAYQQLAAGTVSLDSAAVAFNAAPSATTLSGLRLKFKEAWTDWASCSEFEFGPATDQSLNTHFINSFPTDTVIIKNNIGGTPYTIDGLGNYAAQGFPALDYMLYAYGDATTLARFTTASTAAGAKQYLAALTASLKTKAAAVVNAWSASGGNYLKTFQDAKGTDAGSALSLLINAYIMDFDVTLQNYKVGIPIGIYGPNTLPKSPAKVEGYFSGLSDQLLVAQVQAFQRIYQGINSRGLTTKVAATTAQSNGTSLDNAIRNQLTTLLGKLQALPDPLSTGIQNNDQAVNAAYTEIRKMTVLLKVDMCSALGIRISFQDDDGD